MDYLVSLVGLAWGGGKEGRKGRIKWRRRRGQEEKGVQESQESKHRDVTATEPGWEGTRTVTLVISLNDASDDKTCEFPIQSLCAPSILMGFAARAKSQRRVVMEKSLFRALTHFGLFGKAFLSPVCF